MYTRPNGEISIVIAVPKESIEEVLGPLTDQEYRDHVLERSIPADAINVQEISDDIIPPSREFRNAWRHVAGKIEEDLEASKLIKLKQIREERDARLKLLDISAIQALEVGDSVALKDVDAKKQVLRNITIPLKDQTTFTEVKQLSGLTLDDLLTR